MGEQSTNQWAAYTDEMSAKIEALKINETIEYKSDDGDFHIITKLSEDCGIEQNESDEVGTKKYVRRIEKFCAIQEQKQKIEQKEQLITTQQKELNDKQLEIKKLSVKIKEINQKTEHYVTWEWQENEKQSKWIAYGKTVS